MWHDHPFSKRNKTRKKQWGQGLEVTGKWGSEQNLEKGLGNRGAVGGGGGLHKIGSQHTSANYVKIFKISNPPIKPTPFHSWLPPISSTNFASPLVPLSDYQPKPKIFQNVLCYHTHSVFHCKWQCKITSAVPGVFLQFCN